MKSMSISESARRNTLQFKVQELFREGCYLGDLARCEEDLTDMESEVLNAVVETALLLGHTFCRSEKSVDERAK